MIVIISVLFVSWIFHSLPLQGSKNFRTSFVFLGIWRTDLDWCQESCNHVQTLPHSRPRSYLFAKVQFWRRILHIGWLLSHQHYFHIFMKYYVDLYSVSKLHNLPNFDVWFLGIKLHKSKNTPMFHDDNWQQYIPVL